MCVLFNLTKNVDASANETYLTQSRSPASCAYTSNAISINNMGHMNETSRIRLFDTSTCCLEHWWDYDYFLVKIFYWFPSIIVNGFVFFLKIFLNLIFFFNTCYRPKYVLGLWLRWSSLWSMGQMAACSALATPSLVGIVKFSCSSCRVNIFNPGLLIF